MMDHPHAKGPPHRGHPAADPAVPHHAQREASEFHQVAIPVAEIRTGGPPALVHRAVVVADAVGQLQQQRERGLHHVGRAVVRHVRHHDATVAGRGHIDDVGARRQHADIDQPGQRLQLLAAEHHLVGQQGVGPGRPGDDVDGCGAVEYGKRPQPLQRFPRQVAGIGRRAVKDHDLHGRYDSILPAAGRWPTLPRSGHPLYNPLPRRAEALVHECRGAAALEKLLMTDLGFGLLAARGGGIGMMVRWFIQIVIYDICVTTISEVFGVSRLVSLFIFLGILLAIGFASYALRNRMSSQADADV